MYTAKDLTTEINLEIERLRDAGSKVLQPDWIAQAVTGKHQHLDGDDADFWSYAGTSFVRIEVRRAMNRFKLKPETEADRQLVLPGYERLQEYYLVTRDDQQIAVHVDSLTHQEVEDKIAELAAMAQGCRDHVKELRRYWKARQVDKGIAV